MKKIPMIVLLIAPYIVIAVVMVMSGAEAPANKHMIIVWAYIGTIIFAFIPNMVYAFVLKRRGYSRRQLFFWNMLLKLCHIPAYVTVYFFGSLLFVMIIPLLPFLFLFDYLMLLASSMYGVNGLRIAFKDGTISKGKVMINGVCHFLFLVDVVSAVYLYCKCRKDAQPIFEL